MSKNEQIKRGKEGSKYQRMLKLRRQGKTYTEIGRILGVSRQRVFTILKNPMSVGKVAVQCPNCGNANKNRIDARISTKENVCKVCGYIGKYSEFQEKI